MKQLTYQEWVETYRPIPNTLDPNASYDGMMWETFGKEQIQVHLARMFDPSKVWTLLAEDDDMWIAPGYHLVNRMGYFITTNSFVSEDIEVPL